MEKKMVRMEHPLVEHLKDIIKIKSECSKRIIDHDNLKKLLHYYFHVPKSMTQRVIHSLIAEGFLIPNTKDRSVCLNRGFNIEYRVKD